MPRTWRRVDEAVRAGADDALLVALDDVVLEAPTSNVWFREGDRLLTPSLELPILAGVTRSTLLELAPAARVRRRGRDLPALDVSSPQTRSFSRARIREVMPVVAVDDVEFSQGPAAAALQTALRAAAGYPGGQ